MFQQLQNKPKIIVTGPMRSGTTICAEMIGHDLGREVLKEEDAVRWPSGEWPAKYIVQAPYLVTTLLTIGTEWFAVIMQRDMEAVEFSSQRFFDEMFPNHGLPRDGIRQQLDWMQKNAEEYAKLYPERTLKVQYEDLCSHPLWVEDRSHFSARQTR